MRLLFLALGIGQLCLSALTLWRPQTESRWFRWLLAGVLLISGLAWLWFGIRDWLAPESAFAGPGVELLDRQLAERDALLGLVENGELRVLAPSSSAGSTARLTGIGMAEAVAPESREIDLAPYEGNVLVVRGTDSGGWIYGAELTEQGGPLLTALVQQVYQPTD